VNEFKEPRKLPIWDINVAAYLKLHKISVDLHKTGSRVVFEIPATDDTYRLMELYQENPPVNVLDFVSVLRELRGRMVALRDSKQDSRGQGRENGNN
jgi:hypothetical protein